MVLRMQAQALTMRCISLRVVHLSEVLKAEGVATSYQPRTMMRLRA